MEKREVYCDLSVEEIKAKADELAHSIHERNSLVEEKKEVDSGFTEKLKAVGNRINDLAREVESKKTKREVEIEERKIFEMGTVEIIRCDTKEVIQTRAMTPDERQVTIFDRKRRPGKQES